MITNTIVVTSNKDSIIENLNALQDWLMDSILQRQRITSKNPMQLIILRNLQRVLIISPSREISQLIMTLSSSLKVSLRFTYSLTDSGDDTAISYLNVPKSEKMFLISPPTSPPPEFDYSRCEAPPPCQPTINKIQNEEPEVETEAVVTLLNSKVANITVEHCAGTTSPQNVPPDKLHYQRTALPPISSFSSDEEDA